MEKIPTAEEFFNQWCDKKGYVSIDQADDIEDCMIEFAKLHVEAALKAASESSKFVHESDRGRVYLSVYPLENIK